MVWGMQNWKFETAWANSPNWFQLTESIQKKPRKENDKNIPTVLL